MRISSQNNNTIQFGTATLELVLCLPVLLVLIVGIVWLGNSVIAQTNVTVEARHNTWSKRNESSGTALLFLNDDVVSDQATREVEVSPMFDDAESPESSHDVMAAVWDHEQLPLDKAPNWKQYAIAAANAKTGSLQNGYVDATNQFNQFKGESRNAWNLIRDSLIDKLTSLGESANSGLEGGEKAGEDAKRRLRNQIESRLEDKKDELDRAKEAKDKLDEDSDTLKKVFENRVKRLRAEIEDLKADLEALK